MKGINLKLLLTSVVTAAVVIAAPITLTSALNDVENDEVKKVEDKDVVDNTNNTNTTLDKISTNTTSSTMSLTKDTESVTFSSSYSITDATDIFWLKTKDSVNTDQNLVKQVQLFASELASEVTGNTLSVIYGDASDITGNDIVLELDSSLNVTEQGYNILLEGTNLKVQASDADGLFYGCRNVIQSILMDGKVVAKTDSPDVAERALSLDMGRKYYTVDWIKNLIQEMSWSNMNALVLHFSEEMGLGLESKTYPWLAGRDGSLCVDADITTDSRYITQDELRDIASYAKLYHVELIPSFDSPGHMNYIVKKYNEHYKTDIGNYFHYNNKTAIVQGSRNTSYSRGIDISNTEAVNFTRSLVTEYANLFKEIGCTKFDIGGDELLGWGNSIDSSVSKWKQLDHWKAYAKNRTGNNNAVAYDGFMLYMNDLYDLVTSLGYTSVRMWNDDALRSADTGWKKVVELNKNVEVLYWTPTANSSNNNVWTYLNDGHKVYNYLNYYNYYVLDKDIVKYEGANMKSIYNGWSPYVFDNSSSVLGTGKNTALGNENVLGSAFCIWSDGPQAETEDTVLTNTLPMIRANGAKAWNALAHESIAYNTFAANVTKIGSCPDVIISNVEIIDISSLKALIEEYANYNAADYTEETFVSYTNAVNAGRTLLTKSTYTKAEVNNACEAIKIAKRGLRKDIVINENLLLYKANFMVNRVVEGKLATLSVMSTTNAKSFVVYDDLGNEMVISSVKQTTNKTNIDGTAYYYVKFKVYNPGERVYTVYALDELEQRSAESVSASLTVK